MSPVPDVWIHLPFPGKAESFPPVETTDNNRSCFLTLSTLLGGRTSATVTTMILKTVPGRATAIEPSTTSTFILNLQKEITCETGQP